MPNAAIWTVSASVQVQEIDLASALVSVNRLYSPQANCAMLTPVETYISNGTIVHVDPSGNLNGQVNFFALYVKPGAPPNGLILQYGYNGNPLLGGATLNPGATFLYFDPSAVNYLGFITLTNNIVGSNPIAVSFIAASVNG